MRNCSFIHVQIYYKGTVYKVETFLNEYRSLMALIFDRVSPDDFGECLGMGKCGTCLVLQLNDKLLNHFDRNEQSTLKKHGIAQGEVRLACQLQIDDNINGSKF